MFVPGERLHNIGSLLVISHLFHFFFLILDDFGVFVGFRDHCFSVLFKSL